MKRRILILLLIGLIFNIANGQSKKDFCEKWQLVGYIYWGYTFSPEENERSDYIYFRENGTFESIDEGEFGKGTWKWNAKTKYLYLYDKTSKTPLKLKVLSVSKTQMIVLLKGKDDEIKVKFKVK